VVEDVKFQGQGCAISQASASMLTVKLKGKTLEEVLAIDEDAVLQTLGIPISHARLKCALLSLSTLRIGLKAYQEDGA
ncbi:MAG: iron-sulfur cluster assembly scaffold protein, partial [Thermoplasmata archaeon]